MKRKFNSGFHLVLASIVVSLLCSCLVFALKETTELVEHQFIHFSETSIYATLLFPLIGLLLIYAIRKVVFKGKENKGIREVTSTINSHHSDLPGYKIPSHFINGFLTIIFGGSTGIEVSSVVASSAIGSAYNRNVKFLNRYKKEIICAGAASSITILFNSPLAGIFFAYEVLYRRFSWPFILSICIAALVSFAFNLVSGAGPLFQIGIDHWNYRAIPWFILLGVISGLHSVYLTKMVLWLKDLLKKIPKKIWRVFIGGILVSVSVFFLPSLYGEGYLSIQTLFDHGEGKTTMGVLLLQFGLILLLKPICTSLTLASGGDGGVFAPSIFIGAFLGALMAFSLNSFLHIEVIPTNFIVVGMASVLCASIQAPITSIFLVCSITGNYILIIPLIIGCVLSRITAYFVYPYTVYNVPAK
jgi:chloride channel protein, CIC family